MLQGSQSRAMVELQELRLQLDKERRRREDAESELKTVSEKAESNLAHYMELCSQYT